VKDARRIHESLKSVKADTFATLVSRSYLAAVKKINKDLRRCLVVYDDGCDITWIKSKDVRCLATNENCVMCCGEESKNHNRIVLCDRCDYGYHQACHIPPVGNESLAKQVWWCRDCTFAKAAR
jgi:hypothetical protein